MVEKEKPQKIALDEVMLAMDVVDTLRHEQQLVERELASDERDQALFEKVKRMYASQGLEVTMRSLPREWPPCARNDSSTGRPHPGNTLAGQALRQSRAMGENDGGSGRSPGGRFSRVPICLCGAEAASG